MRTITVNASSKYNIYIDDGVLAKAGELIKNDAGGHKCVIITDTNVDKLYAEGLKHQLETAGYEVLKYAFDAGEENKTIETLAGILSFMAQNNISRKDVAIALGGGVVGDVTGFAAATYMRGIKYVQVPTTVLAAVDSSVGGKTAVDLPEGKNLAGAFYQPKAVICDSRTFDTLPSCQYNNGFAEIIKYAAIKDSSLIERLTTKLNADDTIEIIERCVKIKSEIVEADEFESGLRQILNFGHSIGHAIEKLSNFELLHGEAVACGMIKACEIAEKRGLCTSECRTILIKTLKQFELPVETDFSAREIAEVMRKDKKASAGSINLILPVKMGEVIIENMNIGEIEEIISGE